MFSVVDRISWPGYRDRPNEDACGTVGAWAWVIDTSIFPGTPSTLHPQSDAAWFAGFSNERFALHAPAAEDGPGLIRQVMQDAREAFLSAAPPERYDSVTWPVGALTVVRGRGDVLDVWSFADTTAFVRHPEGSVLTVGEGPELRRLESAKAAELLEKGGCGPKDLFHTPAFRAWLTERRERQKAGFGIPLFGLSPEAADSLRHEEVPCPDGSVILLTSDGFSALVDLYGTMNAGQLLEAALQSGLEPLAARARSIETEEDPEGRRFPRFKVSDDTTALLLSWKQ